MVELQDTRLDCVFHALGDATRRRMLHIHIDPSGVVRRVMTTGTLLCTLSQFSLQASGPMGTLASSKGRAASSEAVSVRLTRTTVSRPFGSAPSEPGKRGTEPSSRAIATPSSGRLAFWRTCWPIPRN